MSCADCPDPMAVDPPLRYVGWRAFYDDGKVYCSREHTWADMPDDGLLVAVVYLRRVETETEEKRLIEASWAFLVEQEGRPPLIHQSEVGPTEILPRYPNASIKRGRWTDDEMFARVEKTALESTW